MPSLQRQTVRTTTICINVRVENTFTNGAIAPEYSNVAARQDHAALATAPALLPTHHLETGDVVPLSEQSGLQILRQEPDREQIVVRKI